MKILPLIGRICFSAIFITSSFAHFTQQTINFAMSKGVIFPQILVPLSGALALLGGLSILLGYRPKIGAWMVILFLVPITLVMHRFWTITDPQLAAVQRISFMTNLSMVGGALLLAYFGSGPYSLRH